MADEGAGTPMCGVAGGLRPARMAKQEEEDKEG